MIFADFDLLAMRTLKKGHRELLLHVLQVEQDIVAKANANLNWQVGF